MIGELADSGGLAHAVDTHHHYYIRFFACGHAELAVGAFVGIACEQIGNFLAQQAVEFLGVDIFVACDTFLDTVDNLEGGFRAHVGCDEDFFELVEKIVINSAPAGYGAAYFAENTFFGLFQTFVQCLFFLFREEAFEKTHM